MNNDLTKNADLLRNATGLTEQRAHFLDVMSIGILRRHLIENFGETEAHTVLNQFGFSHGWQLAESVHAAFEWDADTQCLHVSLHHAAPTPKPAEPKVHERRRAVVHVTPNVRDPAAVVSKSAAMQQVVELAQRVATVDSTVLITGESGSGKERIARLLHDESLRAAGPFIAVNCGAIAETLLESELFGHTRGSFSGATHDRPGLFEAANGGTLLLDEIGEVSPAMQVKLLRALQEREIRRVGENKVRSIDVRIVASTNRDLAKCVTDGSFRQDLFYRLKVVELHVPALRERRGDILALAHTLLAEASLRLKRQVVGLSEEVIEHLQRYGWPGNVRELENVMERAVALARGHRVEVEDLPEEILRTRSVPMASPSVVRPLDEIEKEHILAALAFNGGNQTHTAEQLCIGQATLYRKLKSYSLMSNGAARTRPGRPSEPLAS